MIFEILISYRWTRNIDIISVVRNCLAKVLEDNLNEFDDPALEQAVVPRVSRVGKGAVDTDGRPFRHSLFGFALDLPDETESLRLVVDEFVEALDTSPVVHLVKFEDPLSHGDLARWSEEIYWLEMKLRRVLSLVYLHGYQAGDPYDLLCEETVQPMNKERPKPEHMRERAENQFFHLTFNQYVGLNRRREFKPPELLELIRNNGAYDSLREELSRAPIADEDDAVLLAGLKERMEAIEAMRNCCAHNRRPSKKVEENYVNARPLLNQLLDRYLARWPAQSESIEEMPWECAVREAVEHALEISAWNKRERTVTFYSPDEDRIPKKVETRAELEQYLREVARTALYAHVSGADGELPHEYQDGGVALQALVPYEDQLREFFSE